jgi:hypothetical protein
MTDDKQPTGTRRSRRSGEFVTPQRATEAAWFQTFWDWSPEQQTFALRVLEQVQRLLANSAPAERAEQIPLKADE